jgi:long-subunit acyl-CoA synthetase (AMP-forming)
MPGIEMRIVLLDAKESRPPLLDDSESSSEGELQVRGPVMIERYLGNDLATSEAFTKDG